MTHLWTRGKDIKNTNTGTSQLFSLTQASFSSWERTVPGITDKYTSYTLAGIFPISKGKDTDLTSTVWSPYPSVPVLGPGNYSDLP